MLFSGFFITSHLPYTGSLIEAVTDKSPPRFLQVEKTIYNLDSSAFTHTDTVPMPKVFIKTYG